MSDVFNLPEARLLGKGNPPDPIINPFAKVTVQSW
jgi:hypothetical protein